MSFLYNDVIFNILSFVPVHQLKDLKLVNKQFYQVIKERFSYEGKHVLSSKQKQIIAEIVSKQSAVVYAPLSFGKTVIALASAMRVFRCVILIRPPLIAQWITEAQKMYGTQIYDANSTASTIWVAHKDYSTIHHHAFNNPTQSPRIIFISTNMHHRYKSTIKQYDPEMIILDECQKGEMYSNLLMLYPSVIGLTANMNWKCPNKARSITVDQTEVIEEIPSYSYNITTVQSEKNIAEISNAIINLNLIGPSLLFYTSKGYSFDLTLQSLQSGYNKLATSFNCFHHKQVFAYENFVKASRDITAKKPLLIFSYERGAEGFNFDIVQNIVLFAVNHVAKERVYQSIGRALRITSKVKRIRVEVIVSTQNNAIAKAMVNLIRPTVYAEYLAYMELKSPSFGYTPARYELTKKYQLSELEIFVLFHCTRYVKKVLLWSRSKGLFRDVPDDELIKVLRKS